MKTTNLSKITLLLGRCILVVIGALLGVGMVEVAIVVLNNILANPVSSYLEEYVIFIIRLFASLFWIVILLLSSKSIIATFLKLIQSIEKYFIRFSAKDLLSGTLGLVIGLIVAFLIGTLFDKLPGFAFLSVILALIYITLALLGIRLGIQCADMIFPPPAKPKEENLYILDSSILIDGRITDIAATGFLSGRFHIPAFILDELRYIADNGDNLKRARGRRGLDIVAELQRLNQPEVVIGTKVYEGIDTDTKILKCAEELKAKVITVDYNLNKIANLKKIQVLNINDLTNALKPVAIPGEKMTLTILKEGKEPGQGVAYMQDGTLIVIENGGDSIGQTVEVTVTTVLQTSAGRMIFARIQ